MAQHSNQQVAEFPFSLGHKGLARPFKDGNDSEDKVSLIAYFNLFRRNKWGILGLSLIATLLGAYKAMQEVPYYRASLTMLIEQNQQKIVNIQQLYFPANAYLFYETQKQIFKSRAVAEKIVEKLGLDEQVYFTTNKVDESSGVDIIKRILGLGQETSDDINKADIRVPTTPEDRERRKKGLINRIQSGLSVWTNQKSQIFTISYVSSDPQFAADAANAAAEAYIDFSLEARLSEAKHTSSWLTERLEDLRKKLLASESELHDYQSREGMIDTKSIKKLESGRLSTYSGELIAAQRDYAELAKRYGPKHPKIINAKAKMEEARLRFQSEESGILGAKRKENKLAKLERDVTTNRQLYDLFMTRFKETDITTDKKTTNARILDRAQVPAVPFKPDKVQMITTYFIFGLLGGILLVFARDYLDNTFKTTRDVEDRLNLPVLGIVPLLKQDSKTAVSEKPERFYINAPRSSFSESINHIRTGILFSQVDNPPQLIMVTSSVQSEGKTTLSSNLALSFSQLGRTLLLDADLRKPRIAQITGLDRQMGLVDLVTGQKSYRDCIVKDKDSENLYILRSGTMPPNPLEILSSARFKTLLEELKQNFKYILIDSAPILPVSDAIVLSHVVDSTVLVIQADRTSRTLARDALRRMHNAGVAPIGIALSQVSQRKISQYYDDRYYYENYYSSYHAYGDVPDGKVTS